MVRAGKQSHGTNGAAGMSQSQQSEPESAAQQATEIKTEDEDSKDDDDDDSSADEDDGDYDESREPYPDHAAFDPETDQVTSSLVSEAQVAFDVLAEITCDTPDVCELREKAKEAKAVPDHKRHIVGLLGDAGEGKSSLINSLSDCPRLAKALQIGKACTSTVMEYQGAAPGQTTDLYATIEVYDLPKIGSILSLALADWAYFYTDKREGWSQDDLEYYSNKASTCRSMFRAIFNDIANFETDEIATESLHRFIERFTTEEKEIKLLVKHAAKSLKPMLQPDGRYVVTFVAEDADELWAEIDPYVSERSPDGGPTIWPLVKKVTITVKGSRVLDGVTLVDMPGISDTNQTRVNTTLQHIRICDHLFIVAGAKRVIISPAVNSLLQKFAMGFGGRITVVATRTDEGVDHACAMALQAAGMDIKNYGELKASSELKTKHIRALERKRRRHRRGEEEYTKLSGQISAIDADRQNDENTRWELVVIARNQYMVQNLESERGHHMPAGMKLMVFCVSNRHYGIHKGAPDKDNFLLSPEGTGIPALRQHVLLFAASRILEAKEAYINHRFKVWLGGLRLWTSAKTVQNKQRAALHEIVQRPRGIIDARLAEYQGSAQDQVDRKVISVLEEDRDSFTIHAASVVKHKIKMLPYQTIRAFAKRDGKFNSSIMADSWNELFAEESTLSLEKLWHPFVSDQESEATKMEEAVIDSLQEISERLEDAPAAVSLPVHAFNEALDGHLAAMRQMMREHEEDLQQENRKIYMDATIDGPDNYFARAMKTAYAQCQDDFGDGFKARCIGYLSNHIDIGGHYSPFAALNQSVRTDMKKAIKAHTTALKKDIKSYHALIDKDFETMTRKKSSNKSEVPVQTAIKNYLKHATATYEEAIAKMKAIKARTTET
ncbi:unnamed protein product [Zymoseptoria tritici ST99CH_1A5]|uniref:G domain-containing protein n=1 Tax=Zymoseptoria tritici ST99CH_1A5 TaxID=1276529 RepID=A0A1Y6LBW3_ZYMTR|nr:unnamed protein product [Zymoseptoria tritici ST99CH_3D1]SMY21982.1 unnamed protein product [Zymoseptoria tritici ST99CH_1A5]